QAEFATVKHDDLVLKVFAAAEAHYKEKNKRIANTVLPVVAQVYKNESNTFENIVTPFTDGLQTIQVMANLQKAYESHGKELVLSFEKMISLIMIDDAWKEHLRELDDLKQSVQNASLEQKDPLLIYKLESFKLFREMITKTSKETLSFLVKGNLPTENNQQLLPLRAFGKQPVQQ